MYRLFGLPQGSPVTPQFYRDFAVAEDQPVAERPVQYLTEGAAAFDETLRIQVDSRVKTLRIKAIALSDDCGQPARMVGVDLNITEIQRLEAENLRLRFTQQQVRIAAVLEAQETERHRLAESLHNGLGQTLYATKLRLDQLTAAPQLASTPALATARREADRLLSQAISHARSMSHELTPGIVAEFGLAAALHNICRGLSTPTLRWQCLVHLDEEQPLGAGAGPERQQARQGQRGNSGGGGAARVGRVAGRRQRPRV